MPEQFDMSQCGRCEALLIVAAGDACIAPGVWLFRIPGAEEMPVGGGQVRLLARAALVLAASQSAISHQLGGVGA